jgi:hypothetical protein
VSLCGRELPTCYPCPRDDLALSSSTSGSIIRGNKYVVFFTDSRAHTYQENCSVPHECTFGALERDLDPMSHIGSSQPRSRTVRSPTLGRALLEIFLQRKT